MHGNADRRGGQDGSRNSFAANTFEAAALDSADLFGHDLLAGCKCLGRHGVAIRQIDTWLDHEISGCQPKDGSDNDEHDGT